MANRYLVTSLGFLLSLTTLSADLTARIVTYPSSLPKGAPLFLRGQVCNASGHSIALAYGAAGFRVQFVVRGPGLELPKGCPPPPTLKPTGTYTLKTMPAGWFEETVQTPCYGSVPGEYTVQMIVTSRGPYHQKDGTAFEAWEGEVRSEEAHVTVVEPTGIDAAAYDNLKGRVTLYGGGKVIEQFPTSTYAAYALCEKIDLIALSVKSLEPIYLEDAHRQAIGQVDPSDPKGKHFYSLDAPLRDAEIYLLQTVLGAHPDFPFRYVLDYRLGYDYFSARDFARARASFKKCLAPDTPESIRSVAKVHLDVLDEKGIK